MPNDNRSVSSLLMALRQKKPITKVKKRNAPLLAAAHQCICRKHGITNMVKTTSNAPDSDLVRGRPRRVALAGPTRLGVVNNVQGSQARLLGRAGSSDDHRVPFAEDVQGILIDLTTNEDKLVITSVKQKNKPLVYSRRKKQISDKLTLLIDLTDSEDHPFVNEPEGSEITRQVGKAKGEKVDVQTSMQFTKVKIEKPETAHGEVYVQPIKQSTKVKLQKPDTPFTNIKLKGKSSSEMIQ